MILLLNIAIAILAGWFVYWFLSTKVIVDPPISAIIGVIIAIIVYSLNLATKLLK